MSNDEKENYKLFVISGPSGVGKTSICRGVSRRIPNLKQSISMTTRPQRQTEKEGKDYYFISEEEFLKKIEKDEFIEYAKVHGSYYGSPCTPIKKAFEEGQNCLLEIDVQGALKVKRQTDYYPILIFIAPPNDEELRKRLTQRGTDDKDVIERRLRNARRELQEAKFYNYQVINHTLEQTVDEICNIILDEIAR